MTPSAASCVEQVRRCERLVPRVEVALLRADVERHAGLQSAAPAAVTQQSRRPSGGSQPNLRDSGQSAATALVAQADAHRGAGRHVGHLVELGSMRRP